MATIDLTLDALKIPNINGTFPFGKKITQTELNHGGLSTTEVNSNVMLPFMQMRPKVCDENSDTTQVEYDAKVVFNAPAGATPSAGYTLTMGVGTYVGCTVTYTNLMEYACTVKQSDGTTTLFSVPAGKTMSAMWGGSSWLWTTAGSVTAGDPTPVSSAAVHAAIGSVNLSSQITDKHTLVQECNLVQSGNVWVLYFKLNGTANLADGTVIMKLPKVSKVEVRQYFTIRSGSPDVKLLIINSNKVSLWYMTGTSLYYDTYVTIAFCV